MITVRYEPRTAPYRTLEGQCLHTGTLPSLAYGGKSCSLKWKRSPQDRFILRRYPRDECQARGQRVVRAIGFDASERRRTYAGSMTSNVERSSREAILDRDYFTYWYPLLTWGLDRSACEASIRSVGLPVPPKSACWFCPASKKAEILTLRQSHPDLLQRALALETNALPKLTSVRGLGRSFAWSSFLEQLDHPPLFPEHS